MKKYTPFRAFVMNKWFEHKDELLVYEKCLPEYDDKYYYRKHRWMLKRMFRKKEDQNGC